MLKVQIPITTEPIFFFLLFSLVLIGRYRPQASGVEQLTFKNHVTSNHRLYIIIKPGFKCIRSLCQNMQLSLKNSIHWDEYVSNTFDTYLITKRGNLRISMWRFYILCKNVISFFVLYSNKEKVTHFQGQEQTTNCLWPKVLFFLWK